MYWKFDQFLEKLATLEKVMQIVMWHIVMCNVIHLFVF